MLTVLHVRVKRGCCNTAKLQDQNPCKSAQYKKHSIKSEFFLSVDTFFLTRKNNFVRLPKGAIIGLIWDTVLSTPIVA
jgi:hypothetical protein